MDKQRDFVFRMKQLFRHIPPTTVSTTTTAPTTIGKHFHQHFGSEFLTDPNANLPIWMDAGSVGQGPGFCVQPDVKDTSSTYLTTTTLLMRAQALLMKEIETSGNPSKSKRRSRQHSPASSYRSDSSQSSHFSYDKDQQDRRDERGRHRRRKTRSTDEVDKNGVKFKVGSTTPELEVRESSIDSSDDDDEGLTERLREMDVTDLIEQRDVFTRQIVTSLVALHQLNQELDRRRRRKSYSTFRRKDQSRAQQNGKNFFEIFSDVKIIYVCLSIYLSVFPSVRFSVNRADYFIRK